MKKRGIVMAKDEKGVIVFFSGGEFKKLRINKDVDIGAEIDFEIRRPCIKTMVAAASILFLVVISLLNMLKVVAEPYLYITMDINPGLELAVDSKQKVIGSKAYDEDGKALLSGVNITGMDLAKAVETLVLKAIEEGYISREKQNIVLFTSAINDNVKLDDIRKNIVDKELAHDTTENVKQLFMKRNIESIVQMIHIDNKLRKRAEELNISPGKMAAILEAQHEGIRIDNEQWGKISIKDVINGIEAPEKFFDKLKNIEELSGLSDDIMKSANP
ncbi:hypothetical protein D2962_09160 [Biomaibacter acetigenes]|uniref:RsgI N-terminal anti-sigma domain-containing protein n=1 Tax=Biomaibacter acetigenes TaxID=2316383 RepID=A0A3G2R5T2_9FIRM|nr:hypothetical protein [Biomaibacter acetigenes]AYO30761.1 hypothetical protein D2962_09160 [Biomaibacter acetigenes]